MKKIETMIESLRSCLAPSETWPATISFNFSILLPSSKGFEHLKNKSNIEKNFQFSILLLATLPLLLSSCHKNCVCQGYDGSSYTYTSDEVDARNVTCSNMVFQAGQQFYAVCEWE